MKIKPDQTSILHEIVRHATNIAPSTKDKYLRDLNAWIDFAGGDPKKWTRQTAQRFYANLLARMKSQSANRLFASLEFAAKWWAMQEDNPALNFAIAMKAKSGETADKIALTEAQARALLETCDRSPQGLRDFAMIVVGLETGMRRMSLRSMTFEHSFLQGDAKTGYPTTRVFMKGHGSERIFVPMSDTAIAALGPWFAWRYPTFDASNKRGPIFCGLLPSTDKRGYVPSPTPLSESAVHKIIADRGKAIGVELSPHTFRHTFVTWRADAKFSPHEIAAMTAHAVPGIGALGEYMNREILGGKMRNTTPKWLAKLVEKRVNL